MEVEGIFYVAEVREKEEAWKKYKAAVDKGKTAGGWRVGDQDGRKGLARFTLAEVV